MKRLQITYENLKKLYPIEIQLATGAKTSSNTTDQAISGSNNFPARQVYNLVKTNHYIFSNPLFGIDWYQIKELEGLHSYKYVILPTSFVEEIEVESLSSKIKPVLDKFMSGRYLIVPNSQSEEEILYLYYPEFTITNSSEESHLIKDLVVKLVLTADGIHPLIYGKRFSFTEKELEFTYQHSHLPKAVINNSTFFEFCLGAQNNVSRFISTLTTCTPEQFELLLIQLEQYLVWESTEGTPYISISNFSTIQLDGTNNLLQDHQIKEVAKLFIEYLTPDLLFPEPSGDYIVNPGFSSDKLFEIEKRVTKELIAINIISLDELYEFNLDLNIYQKSANSDTAQRLPNVITDSTFASVKEAFNITPHIYAEEVQVVTSNLIKRLGAEDLIEIFKEVNIILSHNNKVNGTNRSSKESESVHNTETTSTSNSIAQPMP